MNRGEEGVEGERWRGRGRGEKEGEGEGEREGRGGGGRGEEGKRGEIGRGREGGSEWGEYDTDISLFKKSDIKPRLHSSQNAKRRSQFANHIAKRCPHCPRVSIERQSDT